MDRRVDGEDSAMLPNGKRRRLESLPWASDRTAQGAEPTLGFPEAPLFLPQLPCLSNYGSQLPPTPSFFPQSSYSITPHRVSQAQCQPSERPTTQAISYISVASVCPDFTDHGTSTTARGSHAEPGTTDATRSKELLCFGMVRRPDLASQCGSPR